MVVLVFLCNRSANCVRFGRVCRFRIFMILLVVIFFHFTLRAYFRVYKLKVNFNSHTKSINILLRMINKQSEQSHTELGLHAG